MLAIDAINEKQDGEKNSLEAPKEVELGQLKGLTATIDKIESYQGEI